MRRFFHVWAWLVLGVLASAAWGQGAVISSPAHGSTLAGSSQTFQWNDSGASGYQLWVGSSPGGYDIGAYPSPSALTTGTSVVAGGLPTDGRMLHVRLWSYINGAYQFTDATYRAASAGVRASTITSPAAGSTLAGATQTFTWSNEGAAYFQLWIGSTPGGYDLGVYPSTTDVMPGYSVMVSGLPTDGRTVYVRLYSDLGGVYGSSDATYTAATTTQPASITSPANGSTLAGASQLFEWNNAGAAAYQLWVGTSVGTYDIGAFPSPSSVTTTTSLTASGLPTDGRTLHVRLWSSMGGTWLSRDFTYTAATVASTAAGIVSPAPGSTISISNPLFEWSDAGASGYQVWVGSSAGAYDLGAFPSASSMTAGLSVAASRLPTDGRTLHVRLWSNIGGAWQFRDHTYATAAPSAQTPSGIFNPFAGETLDGSRVTFRWVDVGATGYELWIGTTPGANDVSRVITSNTSADVTGLPTDGRTLHVRLWSTFGGTPYPRDSTYRAATGPTPMPAVINTPPEGFVLPHDASYSSSNWRAQIFRWNDAGATGYRLWAGSSQGGSNLGTFSVGTATSFERAFNFVTDGSPVHVRLWSDFPGGVSQFKDFIYNVPVNPVANQEPSYLSPTAGSIVRTGAWFAWGGGPNPGAVYELWLGSRPGGRDIGVLGPGDVYLSPSFHGYIPVDGRMFFARLWMTASGTTKFRDYSYRTPVDPHRPSVLTSPTPGSTLTGTTHQFHYDASASPTRQLWVGSAPRTYDVGVFSQGSSGANAAGSGHFDVSGLPTDGRQLYFTAWTYFQGVPYPRDFTYRAAGTAPAAATITSPAAGTTLTGPSQTFTINDTGADYYGLYAFRDGAEVYAGCTTYPRNAMSCSSLPTNGKPVTLQLHSNFGTAAPIVSTITYNTQAIASELVTPANGSSLVGPNQQFHWRNAGANSYDLWLGTTPGANDLRSYSIAGSSNSRSLTDFPSETTRTVHVRLRSHFDSGVQFRDYSVDARPLATLSPASGYTLPGPTQTFSWNDVGATSYVLSYYDGWGGTVYHDVGTATSVRLGDLPTGRALSITFTQTIAGQTYYSGATYQTTMAPAEIFAPAIGSTLSDSAYFEWNVAGGEYGGRYQIFVGSSLGASDLGIFPATQATYAPGTSASPLPTDGRTLYVRLYTYDKDGTFRGTSDAIFKAADSSGSASITAPLEGAQLGGASQEFQWSNAGASGYQLWLGNQLGMYDVGAYPSAAGVATGTSLTASGIPTDGRLLHARLWSALASGWKSRDYIFAASGTPPLPPAALTSPASGASFGPTGLALSWNAVAADRYEVWVGTRQGERDVEVVSTTGTTAQVATRYNAIALSNGYHVRLLSRMGGIWYFRDYFFAYQSG